MQPQLQQEPPTFLSALKPMRQLEQWNDWRWQVTHCVRTVEAVERLLGIEFEPDERLRLKNCIAQFPMAITPYYLSLIKVADFRDDPVYRQSVPMPDELHHSRHDLGDPLHEEKDSPVPGITHRYPDRVLFHVSNVCAMYCRHCTRKRRVGDMDRVPSRAEMEVGLQYIRKTPAVRDVLLSGGDPFLLSDRTIDWLLSELRRIPHVEVIRMGTRTPVVLPQRITRDLVNVLRKYQPLWVNTHFNHPQEMTKSASRALTRLADAGIPLGNQTVLLAGVNDCPRIMKELVHQLAKNRVRPYYIYQCDMAEGLGHFRTPIGKGIEIVESLVGHTSGFCVPTYVIDAPGGGGKIPMMPNYLMSWSTNKVILRNYEGVITTYHEPESYEPVFCDRRCDTCQLDLKLAGAEESDAVGIARLLADYDSTYSLIPESTERLDRRNDD